MLDHPLLERLDAALVDAVPSMSIAVHGEWSLSKRRLNQVEVVDHVWDARLTAPSALTSATIPDGFPAASEHAC